MTRAVTDAERVPASLSVLSEQRRQQVLAAGLAADPTLTTARVETALAAVARHPAALRSLAVALTANRAALVIGAPPMVGQLVLALRAQGATSLPVPQCAVCSREGVPLTRSSAIAGVCARCRRRELAQACARCGVVKPVAGRDSDQRPVCACCADRPQRECGRCGRVRRIARRAHGDQPDICVGCFTLPQATCSGCGRTRPAASPRPPRRSAPHAPRDRLPRARTAVSWPCRRRTGPRAPSAVPATHGPWPAAATATAATRSAGSSIRLAPAREPAPTAPGSPPAMPARTAAGRTGSTSAGGAAPAHCAEGPANCSAQTQAASPRRSSRSTTPSCRRPPRGPP